MRKIEQINLVLSTMNFKEIHSVLAFLNRKWKYENGEEKVPPADDIRSVAEYCLNQVANSEDETATCFMCGFEAEKIEGTYQLTFILDRTNPLSQILNLDTKNELARKAQKRD